MNIKDVMKALSDAVSNGDISKSIANQMKMEAGINNANFTKKRITCAKRKRIRTLQREARRAQRGTTQNKRWKPKSLARA